MEKILDLSVELQGYNVGLNFSTGRENQDGWHTIMGKSRAFCNAVLIVTIRGHLTGS